MDRGATAALVVYVALVGSLLTPLYDPLSTGRDDSWAVLVVLGAAHLLVGLAIARWWTVALPITLTLVAFVANGAEGLAWLILVLGGPALVLATGGGWLAGGIIHRGRRGIAAGLVAVGVLPAAWATSEWVRRGEHVPDAVQARLPARESLSGLCSGAEPSREQERDLRRRAATLLRELRRRPDDLVTETYDPADGPDEVRRDITIRELAEQQLDDLESCDLELERQLRAAL